MSRTDTPTPDAVSDTPFNRLSDAEFLAEADATVDGRTMRRHKNRDAVIDALIALIREGNLAPTVAEIADRASVSHRSIFRYFTDLNDLARTAIDTEFRHAVVHGIIPDPGTGTLDHRIDTIVAKNLATLDRTHMLGRVARGRMIDIPEIDRGLANINQLRLEQIERQFAPEFDTMDDAHRDAILTSILMTLSFENYDMQRRNLEREFDEIERNWRITLQTLLA